MFDQVHSLGNAERSLTIKTRAGPARRQTTGHTRRGAAFVKSEVHCQPESLWQVHTMVATMMDELKYRRKYPEIVRLLHSTDLSYAEIAQKFGVTERKEE